MSNLKDKIREFLTKVFTSRITILFLIAVFGSTILIYQLFLLQIINGEHYQKSFMLKVVKTKSLNAPRGNIFDRNGKLLATNELAYNVTVEDSFSEGRYKNLRLNSILFKTIKLVEKYQDNVIQDFPIGLDDNQEFYFKVEGVKLKRFKADVFGYTDVEYLNADQNKATAKDVINFLASASKYSIYKNKFPKEGLDYLPAVYTEENIKEADVKEWKGSFTNDELLKLITLRSALSANYYQRYKSVNVALDVNERTRTAIMENKNELTGVDVSLNYRRYYYDSVYFSHILGYTGTPSQEELDELVKEDSSYSSNDEIGKSGLEQSMESYLRGVKGEERLYVNNLGATLEYIDKKSPVIGNNVYLSEDSELQKAAYKILEKKLADILDERIVNNKIYGPLNDSATKIKIPIDDVYFALINNNVIEINVQGRKISAIEKDVFNKVKNYKKDTFKKLSKAFTDEENSINSSFSKDFNEIIEYSLNLLKDNEIIKGDAESVLTRFKNGKLSLNQCVKELIFYDKINISLLSEDAEYFETNEINEQIVKYLLKNMDNDTGFIKILYRQLINNSKITGKELCLILFEQGVIPKNKEHYLALKEGRYSPFNFIKKKIKNLNITPAQLGLDPCTASLVIQNSKTGELLALVTYPGYDLNKLAGKVDSKYYAKLTNDLSESLYNHATQQRTAPGSTYKMVSSIAGLEEGVIGVNDTINCKGIFKEINPSPQCWSKSGHGKLSMVGAIKNSCDIYFYNVAYRLGNGKIGGGDYSSEKGLEKLKKYAKMFGLGEKTGLEIPEEAGHISTEDAVRSAIGQGNNSFTTVELCRYVNTIANGGTCYDLTTLHKITDYNGRLIKKYSPKKRKRLSNISPETWEIVRRGMREVVTGHDKIFSSLDKYVHTSGKTGTAEYLKTRGNHVLFVGYAPDKNSEISVAVRIPFGYTSTYSAEVFRDVVAYYYNVSTLDDILHGSMKKSTDMISD